MLKGTKYGLIRAYYWEQSRNAVEYIGRAIKRELADELLRAGVAKAILDRVHAYSFFESCGADTVVNGCVDLLGPDLPGLHAFENVFPGWKSGPQLDDIVMLAFADPRNADAWKSILPWLRGDDVMENRYMDLHVEVAMMMFGVRGEKKEGRSFDEVYQAIEAGNSVGIHLPGHYVSAGVVDRGTGNLRIKDSWGGRKPEWKGGGFLQPLGRQEFAAVRETVIYKKPA